ncbi:hypothetical protein G4B88_014512 [Cannabis sativa]|uniref:Uncharacterized protein n=1 Tax=Cannabis sativa TaxID=3483 RepID=A0A7J6I9U4_CANSA|nr:hypothetical protein G4B88_014512 [Cannabis sativa]
MAIKEFLFLRIIPNLSESSTLVPIGIFQSKQCKKEANICINILSPKEIPAHILLPDPNGRYLKFLPEKL